MEKLLKGNRKSEKYEIQNLNNISFISNINQFKKEKKENFDNIENETKIFLNNTFQSILNIEKLNTYIFLHYKNNINKK